MFHWKDPKWIDVIMGKEDALRMKGSILLKNSLLEIMQSIQTTEKLEEKLALMDEFEFVTFLN